jgi:Zn finger protein HypA/HybF involved in hydrogenase expression
VSDFGGNIARLGTLDAVIASPGRMLECDACGEQWETWEHGKTCPKCSTLHRSAPKCKACLELFDPHYHGLKCPHCGTQQSELKQCAACKQPYAAFLHPNCPHCGYDNSAITSPGKDLKTRGGEHEAVNVRKIIEDNPWQAIVSPPVKHSGGWLLTTKFTTALWKYEVLPNEPHSVYIKRSTNGRYVAAGIYDVKGQIHSR